MHLLTVLVLSYLIICQMVVKNLSHLLREHSHKLNRTILKLKKKLSIYAIKKFHQYLFGKRFILFTDHKPLLGLFSEKKGILNMADAQMQRQAILLSAYDYTLKYCSGAENSNADFFSCFPSNEKTTTSTIKNEIFMTELSYLPITSKEVADFSKRIQLLLMLQTMV